MLLYRILFALLFAVMLPGIAQHPSLRFAAVHHHGGPATSETLAYDKASKRLFVTNARDRAVDILDLADPTAPKAVGQITFEGGVNSVSSKNGMIAVAVEAAPVTDPGFVYFYQADGTPHAFDHVRVGPGPDQLAFTPDGRAITVANEGEERHGVDPEGSVAIIDLVSGDGSSPLVRTASFEAFDDQRQALIEKGIRIFPGKTVAQDLEPEYVAVAPNSRWGFAALQEANAFARVDLLTATITDILPLGTLDHSLPGNELDASDKNGPSFKSWPVHGMFMPDTLVAKEIDGKTFFFGACEGDHRKEFKRLEDIDLNPVWFPAGKSLQKGKAMGRLKISVLDGDKDNDGLHERLYSCGTRGFAIWNDKGQRVFASGSDFERITAREVPWCYNASNDDMDVDSRSDDKGPEPEAIAVHHFGDKTYALIGLERTGGIMVYDVTSPSESSFVQFITTRKRDIFPRSPKALGLGPESILVIPDTETRAWVCVANEISGTTEVFRWE